MPLRLRSLSALSLLAALLPNAQARAIERITLRNGFFYDCARQQPIDGEHTRLFLSPNSETSYVDIATNQIVAIDPLPTPPPPHSGASSATPTASLDLHTLLASAGTAHNIDVELLASIVHAESSGRTHAVSRTGAGGLMQLMPGTARDLGVADAFQPEQNINGGTRYLDALLTRFHDNLALALAAYNAGPAAVDRFHGVPPYRETRAYVVRVMTEFKRRKQALAHKPGPILQASR